MKRLGPLMAVLTLLVGTAGAARAQVWDFEARLDGRRIGSQRFVVTGPAGAREVESTARFDVTLLGVPVYRYRHEARERWRGNCLLELRSRTEDGGRSEQVEWRREAGEAGCLMGFAYWHPDVVRQARLLNPQTGRIEDVQFERLDDAPLLVGGREILAARWLLIATGGARRQELTLWRDRVDDRFVGLDARVDGRLLTYRLP